MKFEELHNELNQFPDDLKYSEQNWESALGIIQAHEEKVRNRKLFFLTSVSAAAVLVLVLWLLPSVQLKSSYVPRDVSPKDFTWEKDSEQSTFSDKMVTPLQEKQSESSFMDNEKIRYEVRTEDQFRTVNSKSQETAHLENKVEFIAENENQISVKSEITSYKSNTAAPRNNPLIIANAMTQEEKVSRGLSKAEVFNLENYSTINSTSLDEEKLMPLYEKSGVLSSYLNKNSSLRSKDQISSSKGFTRYVEFIGLKLGVNPWAQFGRSEALGSYNPVVGIFAEKLVNEKMHLNAGIEYMNIDKINLAQSTSHTSYGYGLKSEITIVHTDRAHFISLPLALGLRVNPRLQVKTGLTPTLLVQTENTLERHLESNNTSEILSQEKTEGYKSSFSQAIVSASLGINYWVSSRNALQITYHQGITDFSKNEFFQSGQKDFTSRIELSLNRVIK